MAGKYTSNPWGYPSIVEVQKHMVDHYVSPSPDASNWKFEKRKDGYWVVKKEVEKGKMAEIELLWSVETGSFLPLKKAEKRKEVMDSQGLYPVNGMRDIRYDYAPYYGYAGWAEDVIADFGDWKEGSAAEMYGIGLAWGVHTSNLMSPNSGWAVKGVQLSRKSGPKGFSETNWEIWKASQTKAIEWMQRAAKADPGLLTFIGSLRSKASNEVMAAWVNSWVVQGEKEADEWLQEGLFDPVALGMARSILQSCDKDAILLTQGDMDTYPLLYVQEMEKIRTDVRVVNMSLLNWPEYAMAVRRNMDIQFTLQDNEIQQATYVLMGDDPAVQAYTDWINAYRIHDKHEVFMVTGKTVWLPGKPGSEGIRMELEGAYFTSGDWLVMDLFFGYAAKRSIYFTDPPSFFQNRNAWLEWEGWVHKLKTEKNPDNEVSIHWQALEKSLLGENEWLKGEGFLKADDKWLPLVTAPYGIAMQKAASLGKEEEGKRYLHYFADRFGGSDWILLSELEWMYKSGLELGEEETAEKLALRLAENFRAKAFSGYPNRVLFPMKAKIYAELKEFATEKGWKQVLKTLPKKLDERYR